MTSPRSQPGVLHRSRPRRATPASITICRQTRPPPNAICACACRARRFHV